MRNVLKKLVVANHATPSNKKPHLDVHRSYTIPACHRCLAPRGSCCMICGESEKPDDILAKYHPLIRKVEEIVDGEKSEARDKAKAEAKARGEEYHGSKVDLSVETNLAKRDTALQKSFSIIHKDVMFRCQTCGRPAHYRCIPSRQATNWQVRDDWSCGDCTSFSKPIDALLAWRRLDFEDKAAPPTPAEAAAAKAPPGSPSRRRITEKLPDYKDATEEAEYLVKFKEESFRKVVWVSHAWLIAKWPQRLRNFVQKGPSIEIRTENRDHDEEDDDALEKFSLASNPYAINDIPKEWITPDRVLEVEYKRSGSSSATYDLIPSVNMKNRLSSDPQESLDRVGRMYIKWQGLAYESATWETLSKKDDPQYPEFVRQYGIFLRFLKVQIARPNPQMLAMLDKPRPAGEYRAMTEQPEFTTNGQLMDFQLDGVSWLVRSESGKALSLWLTRQ